MGDAQVIQMPLPRRTTLVQPLQVADTGNHPVLCLCSDEAKYWCKAFSAEWPEVPVNEIVAAEVGKAIGAPVLDWAVVDIPPSLQRRRVGTHGLLGSKPMFGSKNLELSRHADTVGSVKKDGNPNRFPFLVALWYLCNAEDIQMLYSEAEEQQVWSIDHGYWFGSLEGPRKLFSPSERAGRPEIPRLREGTAVEAWEAVAERLRSLAASDLEHVPKMIPSEWQVDPSEVHDMTNYVLERVSYTLEILDEHARRARTEG